MAAQTSYDEKEGRINCRDSVATIELVALRPAARTKKDPLQRGCSARWPAPNAVPEDGRDEKPRVEDEGADK